VGGLSLNLVHVFKITRGLPRKKHQNSALLEYNIEVIKLTTTRQGLGIKFHLIWKYGL
jgi:hypothetical protein